MDTLYPYIVWSTALDITSCVLSSCPLQKLTPWYTGESALGDGFRTATVRKFPDPDLTWCPLKNWRYSKVYTTSLKNHFGLHLKNKGRITSMEIFNLFLIVLCLNFGILVRKNKCYTAYLGIINFVLDTDVV